MATTELSLENLKQHVGRRATSTDVVTAGPANLLRLAFARPEPEFRDGDPLPPGWQILYFLPRLGPDELRPDGSPLDSGVVPPMPLPRRMFAGERLRFHQPIRIGDTLRRETELADLSLKTGGTGTLVFATTIQRIFTPNGLALEEERRTVFREEVKAGDFARDSNPGRVFASYTTQARAPLFDTAPFELRGRPTTDGRGCELWAVTPEGTIAMSAQAEFA